MEIFRPYSFDKPLFIAVLILIAFGLVMVFSSSAIISSEKYDNTFHFFVHQIIGAGLGLFFIFVMLSMRKPFYQDNFFIYSLLILTLGLLVLCLFMPTYARTNRWVEFLNFRFQPSELAKISLVLFFAFYLDKKRDNLNDLKTLLFPLSILAIVVFLIIKEPDFGTAILIFVICTLTLFIGGIHLKYFILLGLCSIAGFVLLLIRANSYTSERITAFINPAKDPLGDSFQIIQSKLAIGSGGLFGVSLGESTQKLFFLPNAHTDYIYAIVGEELGFIGSLAVVFLFLIFLWRGLIISWRAPNLFCQIAAAGLTLAVFFQAMLNISIVLGLGPPTGFPLPLFSFGRSSLLCTIISIGILLHISQRKSSTKRVKR
jgi:cell division protein FtsW